MDGETSDPWLAALEYRGSGTFDSKDITLTAGYMEGYHARVGDVIIGKPIPAISCCS